MVWYAEVVEDPPETSGILGESLGSALVRFEMRDGVVYIRDLTDRSHSRAHFRQDTRDLLEVPAIEVPQLRVPAGRNFTRGLARPTTALGLAKRNATASSHQKFDPIISAVEASDMPAIMIALPLLGKGPNGGAVVDVTELFMADLDAFSVGEALVSDGFDPVLIGDVDPHRSYVAQSLSFPKNIYVHSLLTFEPPSPAALLGSGDVRPATVPLSFVIGHTIALLPEPPMQPRLFDERVGYFTSSFTDYDATTNVPPENRSIILRRRLEKKDPSQEVSEPVEPVVFYIGRDVPDQWRPYLKEAVEDWQPAFEEAGFKNAIVAQDAPSAEEDPDWHPGDARWSVIRWVTEPIENAQGPHLADPRSGEILSAHVLVWAEILNLGEQWYFTQAGG